MTNRVTRELLQSPLPEIVERLGTAIANAQSAMDRNALQIAAMMSDREEHGVSFSGQEQKKSLLELGFAPTFYQITEATVEARVAFSMAQSKEEKFGFSASVGVNVYFVMVAATVNASYTNKYSFEANGSSSISTKFVAVPPPAALTSYLNSLHGGSNAPAPSPTEGA